LTPAAIYCIDGLLDASGKFSCVVGTGCTFAAGVNDTASTTSAVNLDLRIFSQIFERKNLNGADGIRGSPGEEES
jgi:hypothetical protein